MALYGVSLPTIGMEDPQAIRLVAEQAEAAGLDSVWAADHIVLPTGATSPYPYDTGGEFLIPPGLPFMDQFTSLAYVAGITRNVRLGTAVTLLPLRHPLSVAKTVATLDALSGGRVIGVAAGWLEQEFEALGLNFAARGRMLDEGLEVLREIWTQPSASHAGEFYNFANVAAYPRPVQQPHPPIWVGGHTRPVMRRAARVGDMWFPPLFQTTPAGLASAYDTVREAAERHGRDRDAVGLALRVLVDLRDEPDRAGAERRGALLGPPEQVVETLAEYQRAGVSHFVFLPQARTLSDVQRTVAMLADQVAPQLRQMEDGA